MRNFFKSMELISYSIATFCESKISVYIVSAIILLPILLTGYFTFCDDGQNRIAIDLRNDRRGFVRLVVVVLGSLFLSILLANLIVGIILGVFTVIYSITDFILAF